jgi:hypothetical protein
VHSGAPNDVTAFDRWSKRHPTYRAAYELAVNGLRPDLALVATIPLVNGAFRTSEPVRAFAEQIARLRTLQRRHPEVLAGFLAAPEPRNWPRMVEFLLEQISFESNEQDAKLLGSPFHRISLDNWLYAKQDGVQVKHPYLSRNATIWESWHREDPTIDLLLDAPGYAGSDAMNAALMSVAPQLTLTRFHKGRDQVTEDRVVIAGEPNIPHTLWLTMYSVVRRASGSHFDADHRLCAHRSCPEWEPNFCNSYPAVPPDWRACNFLRRVSEISARVLT